MSALGLETIFVSDVGDSVSDAIGADVAVLTTDGDGFVFGASVNELTLFGLGDAIACFVTVYKLIKITFRNVMRVYLVAYLRIVVSVNSNIVQFALQDGSILICSLWGGKCDSGDSGKKYELKLL